MKYYTLKSGGYELSASGPFTPDGDWFDQYDAEAGKHSHLVVTVPDDCLSKKIIPASKLPDMLSMGMNLCISERGWAAIQELNVDPSVNMLTAIVQDLKDRPLAKFAYVWPSATCHEILDKSRMGIDDDFLPEKMAAPSEWVLDVAALPPYDLFFGEMLKWIVTDRLRRAFEEKSLTNAKFIDIGR